MNAIAYEGEYDHLINTRFTIGAIAHSLYLVLQLQLGSDISIIASTGISHRELDALKNGDNHSSIELFQRACSNVFLQFVYSISDTGYQARVKAPHCVYRLTP